MSTKKPVSAKTDKTMQDLMRLFWLYFLIAFFCFLCLGSISRVWAQNVAPVLALEHNEIDDQDDMCIWVHPDAAQSLVITADKAANKLFVYDLDGNALQVVSLSGSPGNIDVRYNFPLDGRLVDIVGYVDRDASEVVIYEVQHSQRQLQLINSFDAGNWPEEIYGFCLYRSPDSGKFFAIAAGKSGQMRQWELQADGNGGIAGIEKRTWSNHGQTEGLVADDETGILFAANETRGIYTYDAEPADPNPAGTLIAQTGRDGLTADVEGIAIYYAAAGNGYLIASSQGNNTFKVYERQPPHIFIKSFSVSGASDSDGIDVANLNFGSAFSQGLFLLHNGSGSQHAVLACDYADLELLIDTDYWNPRDGTVSAILPDAGVPGSFELLQNYPNPFNPATQIRYHLNSPAAVTLRIYDLLGKPVATLVDERQAAGAYQVQWNAINPNGSGLPGGIYFAQLQADQRIRTIKMTLMK